MQAIGLFAFLIGVLLQEARSSGNPTRIRIHKGWIVGNRLSVNGGTIVHEYLGIPMGKPPINEKRFRRPEPVDPWPGEFKATKKPNPCYNLIDTFYGNFTGSDQWNPKGKMSEDCLYINIWVPNPEETRPKKPIMIWIFGGGFYSGSSTLDLYDGRYLAATQNAIVVSMQYRLGILGFLNLDNSELAPGNMGLLDQLLGLQWTQENAEYFHGDKNNVTLFGESAGAVSVGLHLISPLSRNLFNRAILQSGAPTAKWSLMSSENSWLRLNRTVFGPMIKCPKSSHVPTIIKCLLNTKAELFSLYTWAPDAPIQFSWLPSVDYYFLTERPEVSLKMHRFKKCPIMVGSNANEGSSWIVYDQLLASNYRNDELNFSIPHSTHRELIERTFKYYPMWDKRTNKFGLDAITFRYTDWRNKDDTRLNRYNLDMALGDFSFLCPVNLFGQYYVEAGMPVYAYHFTHRSTRSPWGKWLGVMHGDEIMFVFGEPIKPGSLYTDDEKRLSLHMMQLWANFSKTGDPHGLDTNRDWSWPSESLLGRDYYELSIESLNTPQFGSGPRTEYCAFWHEYLPGLVQGTADIHEVEYEWKRSFADWNNRYIVDWKHEYNNYIRAQYDMPSSCESEKSNNGI